MPRVSLPPEFAIAQLTAVAAINAVLFALFPVNVVFPFAIARSAEAERKFEPNMRW